MSGLFERLVVVVVVVFLSGRPDRARVVVVVDVVLVVGVVLVVVVLRFRRRRPRYVSRFFGFGLVRAMGRSFSSFLILSSLCRRVPVVRRRGVGVPSLSSRSPDMRNQAMTAIDTGSIYLTRT